MKQRSLRRDLFRLGLILIIQTILILAGVIFISVSLIQNSIIERQRLLINTLVSQGNLFLLNTQQFMINQAHLIEGLTFTDQNQLLTQIRADYPRFESLQLIDPSGRVVAESADSISLLGLDMSGEPFYKVVQKNRRPYFSDPFVSLSSGHTALTVAAPIDYGTESLGVLTGELSLSLLQRQVIQQTDLGEETISFIVDNRGTLIAHPNQDWVQERRNLANMKLVQIGLAGQEAVEFFYEPGQNVWMIGSVQTMSPGWAVVTMQPVSVAARPLITMFIVAGLAFTLSLLLFWLIIRRNVRQITAPISELVSRADALAAGNFEASLIQSQPGRFTELNSLNQSFIRMVQAVQERDQTLAQQLEDLKQAEQQLQAYANELERSNHELKTFAYISSHDLQEPLRKIQAFGDRLVNKYGPVLDEQGLDYLNRMRNAAARMQTLIIDLLAFSRVMSTETPFEKVNLERIVAEVLVDLERQIEEVKGVVEVSALQTISADPTQMRQLFQNLISNGLKYHRPGVPPHISIKGIKLDNNLYQISVSDNGIGFDEKYLDRIFEVFQRLHTRTEYDGTGIGLAVCKRIVERHGGTITAQGKPDEGATFVVTLPVK